MNLPAECKSPNNKHQHIALTLVRLCVSVCVCVCRWKSVCMNVCTCSVGVCVFRCQAARLPRLSCKLCVTMQRYLTHQFSRLGWLQDFWRDKEETHSQNIKIKIFKSYKSPTAGYGANRVNIIYCSFTRWSNLTGSCWNLYAPLFKIHFSMPFFPYSSYWGKVLFACWWSHRHFQSPIYFQTKARS